jgi:hypothetical protein
LAVDAVTRETTMLSVRRANALLNWSMVGTPGSNEENYDGERARQAQPPGTVRWRRPRLNHVFSSMARGRTRRSPVTPSLPGGPVFSDDERRRASVRRRRAVARGSRFAAIATRINANGDRVCDAHSDAAIRNRWSHAAAYSLMRAQITIHDKLS